MKKQVVCIRCKKIFWSKVIKLKITRERMTLDNICQACKNNIRQRQMKHKETIRVIPAEFEKYVRMRELRIAEMERRKKEEEEKR